MTARPNTTSDLCPRCRKGHVSAVTVDGVYSHEGATVAYIDEFMRCDYCEREFYTPEQSMAKSRAITSALRQAQGFLSNDEIRAVRNRYRLSLADFERALGVGQKTVGRWERGTVPPIGAANLGLWVAAHYPAVFVEWAKKRGITINVPKWSPVTAQAKTTTNRPPLTVRVVSCSDGASRAWARLLGIAMATVHDVAKYILSFADPEEGEVVTHLKLQKLVYYAQGFHLAFFNEPLFQERIEAWRHGPVAPDLYAMMRGYGSGPIPAPEGFDAAEVLSGEQMELLDEIYHVYGQFSALRLRDMTHDEPPWKEADGRGFNCEITHEAMRAFFVTRIVQ